MSLPAPVHVAQLAAGTRFPNGRPSGSYDCMVATGRMALDAYSHGALRPSTTEFRAAQRDQDTNGIGLDDVAESWRHWGQRFDHGSHPFRAVYARLVAGDGAAITGNYGNMGSWSAQPSFRGPHAMWLQRTAPGGILTDDPLRSSAVVIPTATIERFFSGQAGWGHGVFVGDTTGSGADTALGAQLRGILTGMGLTDRAHRISQDEAFKIAIALQGGIASGYTPQLAGGYVNRTVGEVLDNANVDLGQIVPDVGAAIGQAAGELGQAVGDAAVGVVVNVAILGSIIGLTYLGLKSILTSPAALGR